MRYAVLLAIVLIACGESESLTDDEIEYVNLSVALGNARAASSDSARHSKLRDSVLGAFGTTKEAFEKRTERLARSPDRTALIFRTIGDSLGIR